MRKKKLKILIFAGKKYHKFLVKCKEPDRKYYHSKQMRIEDELTNPVIVEI